MPSAKISRFYIIVVLLLGFVSSDAARILALFPVPIKSHLIIHSAISEALTERGHDLTVVTSIPLIRKNPNYRHITIEVHKFPRDYFSNAVNKAQPIYKQFMVFTKVMRTSSNNTIMDPNIKKLMAEDHFDLVILGYFYNDFLMGVAAHFKCPIVLSFMVQPVRQLHNFVGNPMETSYVPNMMIGAKQPMSFWERVRNFIIVEAFEPLMLELYFHPGQKVLYDYHFPSGKYPSFEDMKKNVSLVLVNHHFSQGPIRPNVPGLIEIGGIHIKDKPDPLPEDIKSILDNAKNGVIYFSFGTNIQGDILNQNKSKIMFDVLSKLPYTVLWKWGTTQFPGQAPNVIYKTWLPQDDLLAHPNVKLFVTHGGQGSIAESIYHGVPMVGVPLFAEQHVNAENLEKSGYGRHVVFTTMTEESFGSAVNDVLTNTKYRDNVQAFARLYKDRPMTAKQTAVFWIEYVLRHKGAAHMQSPAIHLNKLQLMSLDVIGFLAIVVYLVVKVLKLSVCYVCGKFRKCKNFKKNKKE